MNKILLFVSIVISYNALAENGSFKTIIKPDKGFIYTKDFFEVEKDWNQISDFLNCTAWTPDVETIKQGDYFNQSRYCDIKEEKLTEYYSLLSNGSKNLLKTEKEIRTINSEFNQTAIGTDFYGILLSLTSQQNTSIVDENNKNKTSHPNWEHNFSLTKDFALTSSTYANQLITTNGYINWFNPEETYRISVMKACYGSDIAESHIRYLDKDDKVMFWTKSFANSSKAPYGSHFTYGKASDESDVHYTGTPGQWPYVDAELTFDKENGIVSFKSNTKGTAYEMSDWSLSGVNVEAITRIQLVSSRVVTTYTGGTCGANVKIFIEDDKTNN